MVKTYKSRKTMNQWKRLMQGACLLAVAAMAVGCSGNGADRPRPMTVMTTQALPHEGSGSDEYVFMARPLRTTELSFRVGGPVDQLAAYAGSRYRRGSTVAEIDARDYRIHCSRAEAVYRQKDAEHTRMASLYERHNVSAAQYERARAEWKEAKAAYDVAVCELEDTRLVAPFDGYVGEVFVERYQHVKPSQPVLSFIDISQLRIEVYVPQQVALAAQSVGEIEVRWDTDPHTIQKAKVVEVSKGTTRNNLSYMITALYDNPDGHRVAGMTGRAWLTVAKDNQPHAVVIPQQALCHRPTEGDFVWVVDSRTHTVHRQRVKSGAQLPCGRIVVTDGLKAGQTVATSGLRFMADGMQVDVKPVKKGQS